MSWRATVRLAVAGALTVASGLGVTPASLTGQVGAVGDERPISLEEAVEAAMRGSPDVEAARSRAGAAEQGQRAAGAFRWPTVGLEVGAIHSNDPVAAFGGRLRQARFTQADFDPARLNHPDPLTDWSGAVGVAWTPLDFSSLAGRDVAVLEADAAGWAAEWTARAAGFRAEARYVEAVAAERQLRAARAAEEAAAANLRVTEQRRDQGILTDADVLQARAALSGAEARRIDGERAVADARERLAVALGWPAGRVPVPTDTTFTSPPLDDAGGVEGRADLRASAARVEADRARERQASRARLPTVRGFARLETHSTDVFDDVQDDWSVGFQIEVPLFTGFEIDARRKAAAAMHDAAAREHDQSVREARARIGEARRGLDAATRGAQAAHAAAGAAEEAARLMRRRFEEGMTTTADLLAVEAQAAELRSEAVNADLMRHLAAARLAFLTDSDTDVDGDIDADLDTDTEDHLRGGTNR